jgi:hypothetical protein
LKEEETLRIVSPKKILEKGRKYVFQLKLKTKFPKVAHFSMTSAGQLISGPTEL